MIAASTVYMDIFGQKEILNVCVKNIHTNVMSWPCYIYFELVIHTFPRSGEMYSIQYYVIKFVCDLWQVGALLPVLCFLQPIKLTVLI